MANISLIAVRLAETLMRGDLVYIADEESQAEQLSEMLTALVGDGAIIFLPSSDALPGDDAPPSPANTGRRMAALHRLRMLQQAPHRPPLACLMSVEATVQHYPPPEHFDRAPPTLHPGDTLEAGMFETLVARLGYIQDDRVDEPGEVAIRGNVIDIFPADAGMPVRIETGEGRVTALRSYEPGSQRTIAMRDALEIGRATEPAVDPTILILRHLKPGNIAFAAKVAARRKRLLELAADARGDDEGAGIAIEEKRWSDALADWSIFSIDETDIDRVPYFAESRSPILAFTRFARSMIERGRRLVVSGSARDLRFLRSRVSDRLGIEMEEAGCWSDIMQMSPGRHAFLEMAGGRGFTAPDLVLVTATDLLGSRASGAQEALRSTAAGQIATDMRCGDMVIHEDHGIAIVEGLEAMPVEAGGGEAIALRYAAQARRLLPIDQAARLWRYGAQADAVALDKLDGSSWKRRQRQIQAALRESATALATRAQQRSACRAPKMEADPAAYERFASGFAFTETEDQSRAIGAVRADMASGSAMDRLLVGDVGYGKTEIALRAAAICVLAGYQVMVIAPTTVLIGQHLETFKRRFEVIGGNVCGYSRLTGNSEKKEVEAALSGGSASVVIGSTALLSKSIRPAKLGLIIVDEEQRFGAADKAQLRKAADVHMLTLSATPIPRTLQAALVGLQQISIIATPPARRQPVRTSLAGRDMQPVRTALLREKSRGGQSFVVVARIADMAAVRQQLEEAVPELHIVEAHGKMPVSDVDRIMVAFAGGKGDVLLATNIIEAGLDVPRANTMIVWHADRFGLAQLHQLRGRVGRGNRRGQLILLGARDGCLSDQTVKRLRTLATYDQLGAGFEISARDLDLRGAGDLVGETQAGHIRLVGIDLYQAMLRKALRQARGERVDDWSPELRLGATGFLPEDWLPETDIRLNLYVRLARLEGIAELQAFEEEVIDRFGSLPAPAMQLLCAARIRLLARGLGIARIDAGSTTIALTLRKDHCCTISVADAVKKRDRLIFTVSADEQSRLTTVEHLLESFIPT
ncbi:TRCF domain-containing protein [Flavisphingomonas formosensis]|uniref:TRCF domain-containing protein n=1 Tax=Flavisphingomonas formosensis TaxID=861534 RepID=UPI0012FA0775|nr:TRCF domain-containing protein [Sphingomonas formosensis]